MPTPLTSAPFETFSSIVTIEHDQNASAHSPSAPDTQQENTGRVAQPHNTTIGTEDPQYEHVNREL